MSPPCDIIKLQRGKEIKEIKKILKIIIWFIIINLTICNEIWQDTVNYWWLIEIVVLIISVLISD